MDISVIVPVFNVEPYLQECLDSILAQTGVDMEVICVNDGSTDGSGEILAKAAHRDVRIKVLHHENSGLSISRNRGMEVATGKYLMFVDSDDTLPPGVLAWLVELADREELDHIVFGADSFIDNHRGVVEEWRLCATQNYYRIKNDALLGKIVDGATLFAELIESNSFYATAQLRMLKRSVVATLRFCPGIIHEDNHFTPLAMMRAKRAIVIPEKCYCRRLRYGSIMTEKGTDMRHAAGCFAAASKLNFQIELPNGSETRIEKAVGQYIADLLELASGYFYRAGGSLDLLSEELRLVCTNEECRIIQRIALPLLASLDELKMRVNKYRSKRFSSRVKKFFRAFLLR